jgi:hypothetical protein
MTCKAMTDPDRIRRCDDPEIKRRALTMLEQNILPVSDIAKILGLAHSTVTKWAAEAKPKVAKNLTPPPYVRGLRWFGVRGATNEPATTRFSHRCTDRFRVRSPTGAGH